MTENKLGSSIKFKTIASYNVFYVVLIYVFIMLSLGHILISDLVVANLFMHSLSDIILLYLATPFYTIFYIKGVFA